jgi:hypothetical protein
VKLLRQRERQVELRHDVHLDEKGSEPLSLSTLLLDERSLDVRLGREPRLDEDIADTETLSGQQTRGVLDRRARDAASLGEDGSERYVAIGDLRGEPAFDLGGVREPRADKHLPDRRVLLACVDPVLVKERLRERVVRFGARPEEADRIRRLCERRRDHERLPVREMHSQAPLTDCRPRRLSSHVKANAREPLRGEQEPPHPRPVRDVDDDVRRSRHELRHQTPRLRASVEPQDGHSRPRDTRALKAAQPRRPCPGLGRLGWELADDVSNRDRRGAVHGALAETTMAAKQAIGLKDATTDGQRAAR